MPKKILIYGGSSLISKELISIYSREDYNFIIFCRKKEFVLSELSNLKLDNNKFEIFETDLIDLQKNLSQMTLRAAYTRKIFCRDLGISEFITYRFVQHRRCGTCGRAHTSKEVRSGWTLGDRTQGTVDLLYINILPGSILYQNI